MLYASVSTGRSSGIAHLPRSVAKIRPSRGVSPGCTGLRAERMMETMPVPVPTGELLASYVPSKAGRTQPSSIKLRCLDKSASLA